MYVLKFILVTATVSAGHGLVDDEGTRWGGKAARLMDSGVCESVAEVGNQETVLKRPPLLFSILLSCP